MPGTPMLKLIEDKMRDLIEGMQGYPYNYAWGNVNERDLAKAKFPQAVIYFETENSLDESSGTWAGAYFNEVVFRIEVRARHDNEKKNPVQEIHLNLYSCLDDLKSLFGNYWNLEQQCDTIMYQSTEIEEEGAGDIMVPSKLITRWIVCYEQDRKTPTQIVQ